MNQSIHRSEEKKEGYKKNEAFTIIFMCLILLFVAGFIFLVLLDGTLCVTSVDGSRSSLLWYLRSFHFHSFSVPHLICNFNIFALHNSPEIIRHV